MIGGAEQGRSDPALFRLKNTTLVWLRRERENAKTTEAAGMDFHHENFLRRSRYATVFSVLLIAFGAITVLNINTGNVHISVENILKIIFLRQGEEMEYNIIWKIRLPRI